MLTADGRVRYIVYSRNPLLETHCYTTDERKTASDDVAAVWSVAWDIYGPTTNLGFPGSLGSILSPSANDQVGEWAPILVCSKLALALALDSCYSIPICLRAAHLTEVLN